ncbi:MAG TPA: ABC transporter ATP-binding protein [Sphingobacteriaceae bacterium]
MEISLENIGRRFNREWIFRGISRSFASGNSYAVLGPNGSGKSTLLQILAGSLTPSEGTIAYLGAGGATDPEKVFRSVSIAAPYLELIEEFTLNEIIRFHFRFKQPAADLSPGQLISLMELEKAQNKQIRYFSSGMKQRVKLALAICSDSPVLILDEPASNLDRKAVDWYHRLIAGFTNDRIVLVGSNQEHEYDFCREQLLITDYK